MRNDHDSPLAVLDAVLDPIGHVAEHDTQAEALLDRLGPLEGRRFLEVGCGDGVHLSSASRRGALVWGVDPSAALLWLARSRLDDVDLRLGTADELPFDTGSFDVVCRFGFSEDTVDTAESLGEMIRVCRRGGAVAVTITGFDEADTDRRVAAFRRIARGLGLGRRDPDPAADRCCAAGRRVNERHRTVQAVILTM